MSCRPIRGETPEGASADARADRLGMGGSALCLVHCTGTGVMAGFGSVAGRLAGLAEAWLHPVLALALVPVALVAMREGDSRVRILLGLGSVLVLLALVAGHPVGHGAETGLTVAGSVLLLAGHRRNRRRHGPAEHGRGRAAAQSDSPCAPSAVFSASSG